MMASRIGFTHRTSRTVLAILAIALVTGLLFNTDAFAAEATNSTKPAATPPRKAPATQPAMGFVRPRISVGGLTLKAAWPESVREHGFWNRPRTRIQLRAWFAPGGVMRIDANTSKITTFTDNKGTNFLKYNAILTPMGSGYSKSSKRQMSAIAITVTGLPAAGATRLHVGGTLAMFIASKAKTYTCKHVAMRVGTVLKAGPLTLVVKNAANTNMDFAATKANANLTRVAKMEFVGAYGKVLDAQETGGGWVGYRRTAIGYRLLHRKVQAVTTIKFTIWQGIKKMNVPFDMTTSLDLKALRKVNLD